MATLTFSEICFAMVRATSLRILSPTTIHKYASVWLLECRESTEPDGLQDSVWHLSDRKQTGHLCEESRHDFTLQDWKEMVRRYA